MAISYNIEKNERILNFVNFNKCENHKKKKICCFTVHYRQIMTHPV